MTAAETRLATLWAPAPVRDAFAAILALDAELLRVVTTIREPLLAEIRLAWWRERLTDLASGRPAPAQPLLQALEAASRAHPGLDLARLSRLEDAFLPLLADRAPDLAALAFARGAVLAEALLSLVREAPAPAPGARIALAGFLRAPHPRITPAAERWAAAPPEPFETDAAPAPRLLRPLDTLALLDIAAARRRQPLARAAMPSRQLRLAAAALGLPSTRRP